MKEVTVYSTPSCPFCVRAKSLLKAKGVEYREVDVSTSDALRSEMMAKAGGRKTVPQIFVGDTHVGGFDDLSALDRSGKLDPLLA